MAVKTPPCEVKCYVKRRDVGVVGVVDDDAVVECLYYFESHLYRLKRLHAFIKFPRCEPHVEGGSGAEEGVVDCSLADEGERVGC